MILTALEMLGREMIHMGLEMLGGMILLVEIGKVLGMEGKVD